MIRSTYLPRKLQICVVPTKYRLIILLAVCFAMYQLVSTITTGSKVIRRLGSVLVYSKEDDKVMREADSLEAEKDYIQMNNPPPPNNSLIDKSPNDLLALQEEVKKNQMKRLESKKNLQDVDEEKQVGEAPEQLKEKVKDASAVLPTCDELILEADGFVNIDQTEISSIDLETKLQSVQDGHWQPTNCTAVYKVALIIPYRDREVHLRILLNNLLPFMATQLIDYTIFVVEPIANQTFNRAKLMNVGYAESTKFGNWDCFIFHDVDLLPESLRTLYTCNLEFPRHMSFSMNKYEYKMPYNNFLGGVTALTRSQYSKINGMSNDFWGWGGEDDDLFYRIRKNNMSVFRSEPPLGHYTMIKHTGDKGNPRNRCRFNLLRLTNERWIIDGLNTLRYKVESITKQPLYIHILVDLLEEQSKEHLKYINATDC